MATKTITWSDGSTATLAFNGQGNGTIVVTCDPNNNYEQRSAQVTVKTTDGSNIRKTITIVQAAKVKIDISTATVTAANQTYSGSALTPTPTVTLNGTTIPSSGYDVAYSNNKNAGTATVTITGKGDYTGTASGNFTINKADPTYTAPAANPWTYNGTSYYLVTEGSTSHGTIFYSSNGSSWSTIRPSTAEAGTYTTHWKLTGDSNHNDVASTSISTTVSKAPGSVTTAPTAKDISYTGSAQTVANAGNGTGTMYYRLGSSGSYSTTIPTTINPGTYTLYYYAAASTNYNQSSTGSIIITMKESYSSTYGYVSNGLVFAIDGISKGHDSSKWLDLVGGLEFPFENCTKGSNCVTFNGSGLMKTYCSKTFSSSTHTIEVVCDRDSSSIVLFPPNSGDVMFGFSGGAVQYCSWSTSSAYNVLSQHTDKMYSFNANLAVFNGRKMGHSDPDSWSAQIDGYLKIGGRGTDKFYSGNIYAIRIYNRKLTESEMRSNHEIDNSRFNLGFHVTNTYISSGLIFQLDGINKGSGSTYWTDLAGGVTFPYGSVATKGSNCVTFNGSGAMVGTPAKTYSQNPGTIEACYTRPSSDSAIVFPASQGQLLLLHRPYDSTSDRYYYGSSNAKIYTGDIEQYIFLGMNDDIRVKNTYPDTSYLSYDSWAAQMDGTIKIGARGTDYKYSGSIYAIRMYNRNLTTKEIIQNQRLDNIRFGLNIH